MVLVNQHGESIQIVLRPNQSLSWHGNLIYITALGVVALIIAIGFAVIGAWGILPFSLLEILALFIAILIYYRQSQRQEVITISPSMLKLEWGRLKIEGTYQCERRLADFIVHHDRHPWEGPEIQIKFKNIHRDRDNHLATAPLLRTTQTGDQLEDRTIGSFLNRADRLKLIKILKDATANRGLN